MSIASEYSARFETGALTDPSEYHATERIAVHLDDPRLARITRLRLLTDRDFPYWDLSYCHGELRDGTPVRITLPVSQFRKRSLRSDLTEMCRKAGVYGKGLGIFDALSTLR